MQISVSEAKSKLTKLVRLAEGGDDILLTRHGVAVARLAPLKPPHDAAALRKLIEGVQKSAVGKGRDGVDAAHSQDFLYGEDGLPG